MPADLEVRVKDPEVLDVFARLERRLRDLRPVFRVVGEIVQGSIERNFEEGGRPGWKPLKPATIRQRRREGKWPGQILVRSGSLKRQVAYQAHPDRVVLTANSVYAAAQHFGTIGLTIRGHVRRLSSGRKVWVRPHEGNIPPRPFMLVQDRDWEAIRERIADFLVRSG